jgi:putative Mn2+ efflux pump MntP
MNKHDKNYEQTNQIVNIVFKKAFLQSYLGLRLRNMATGVKIMFKTWNFQEHSTVTFTCNFIYSFMELKDLLLCSQEPTTGPCSEPDKSSLYH